MTTKKAKIVCEFEIDGVEHIHGVTYDGASVWFADGTRGGLTAVDPGTGKEVKRFADIPADAGTAFDGKFLYQLAGDRIQKIDRSTGKVVGTIPAPSEGRDSGLTWAEGVLWVGEYKPRRIHKIDPRTGKVLKTIQSDRFVTGVTWVDGQLWHGTWEGDESDVRRIDPETGDILDRLEMPRGTGCSGLEADDKGRFWCGGGDQGKLRAIARPV
jgi:outer membrane protein assembly factor BamB